MDVMLKILERYVTVIKGHINWQNVLGVLKCPIECAKNIGKYIRMSMRSDTARLRMKMSWKVRVDLFLATTATTSALPNNPRKKILK